MSELEIGSLILAAEFALIAWAILFFLLRQQRQQINSDHAHVGAAMERLETAEVSRRDALTAMFESSQNLQGEALESKVSEYLAREKAFYNAMLSLYLERDGARLKDLPVELTKVLTPWADLASIHLVDTGDLETEKSELAAELENTKRTLDELMSEYSAAFSRSQSIPAPAAVPVMDQPVVSRAEIIVEEESLPLDQDDFDFLSGTGETDNKAAIKDELEDDELTLPFNTSVANALEPEEVLPETTTADAQGSADPSAVDNPDLLEYELAQDELEGLADLFDSPSSKN